MVAWLARWLGRLGECGVAGVIGGAVVGMLLTLLYWMHGGALTLTTTELWYVALVLAAFGWIVLIFVLVALVRSTFTSVAIPSLVNTLLVAVLTTFVSHRAGALEWAWLIGMLVGALVGYLLCTLYRQLTG
jgi:hypothetical protein